jgi:hypothetical protein
MKYYRTDSRKITFTEYWRLSRKGFLIGWLNKILGIQMNLPTGIPEPQPFRDKIVERDRLPPPIIERLSRSLADLQELGFDQFWFYASRNSLAAGFAYGVQALHPSLTIVGKVVYVSYRARESLVLAFLSALSDGTVLGTTNKKQDFNDPLRHIIQRKPRANARALWSLHQKKLTQLNRINPPQIIADFDRVAAFEDKNLHEAYEDKIRRGIWVAMSNAEVTDLRSRRLPPPLPS